MKWTLFLIIISLSILDYSALNAQGVNNRGDKNLQVGIAYDNERMYGDIKIPLVVFTYDYMHNNKISYGGLFGIGTSEERFDFWDGYGGFYYTCFVFGISGKYHFINNSNIDAYVGTLFKYNYIINSWIGDENRRSFYTPSGDFMVFGAYLGGRYYINPKFALFTEIGYGVGYITIGAVFKL